VFAQAKTAQSLAALCGFQYLVEVRGVEPLSENASTKISPGAVDSLHSLTCAWIRQTHRLSSFIIHGELKALLTHVHHSSDTLVRLVVLLGRMAGLIKPQQEQYYCCSLIYKGAHFERVRLPRPLSLLLHPRRTQYTPVVGAKFAPFASPQAGNLIYTLLLLLSKSQPLRWVDFW